MAPELRIPLSAPDLDEQDVSAVVEVLRSARLSLGPKLEEFETEFSGYIGVEHGIAVSSGTAGLHLALLALGIGPGDEVVVPSFTFIAAANAIRYVGATPIFVDIEASTWNLDPEAVESAITTRTRALIIVHTFGLPANITRLMEISGRHGLMVIEDACEAIGAEFRGRKVGGFGDAGVFGFYPNKQMTTGEGGMVVTSDPSIADTLRSLRNQGRRPGGEWFDHAELGYNYRLSEISCALGLSQLRRLSPMLARRRQVAEEYHRQLCGCESLILPPLQMEGGLVSWFVYVVRLREQLPAESRETVRRLLAEQGIASGRYFAPIHLQPAYREWKDFRLPVTERIASRTLALPFYTDLESAQIEQVGKSLKEAIDLVCRDLPAAHR